MHAKTESPYSRYPHPRQTPEVELYDAIARRRMVRNFDPAPIPPETVDRILGQALRAPSAGFTQGTSYLVLEHLADRERFWDLATEPGWQATNHRRVAITRAPVIIVPLASKTAYTERYAEPDKAGSRLHRTGEWPAPYWIIDAAMATMLILMAAVEEGLGGLFFAIFGDQQRLCEAFGVPASCQPIGAIALGHPAPDESSPSIRRGRKTLEEVVHRGRW